MSEDKRRPHLHLGELGEGRIAWQREESKMLLGAKEAVHVGLVGHGFGFIGHVCTLVLYVLIQSEVSGLHFAPYY